MNLFDPLTYDTRSVAPPPGPPRKERGERLFATGTEAMDWQQIFCYQCRFDHDIHIENGGPGCRIYADELFDRAERFEIVDGSHERGFTLPAQVVCNAFVQCDEPGCEEGPDPELRATKDDPTHPITYREWAALVRASCGPFTPVIPYEYPEEG
jgi:hypothetical protein